MTDKSKKALKWTSIASAAILAPVAFAVIPYAIQKSIFKKENQRLDDKFNLKNEEYKLKIKDDEKTLKEKEAKIKEINEKITKETEETKKKELSNQLEALKKELFELDTKNKKVYNEIVFPVLEESAIKGYGIDSDSILERTKIYLETKSKEFENTKNELAKKIKLESPKNKQESEEVLKFYKKWTETFNKIRKSNLDINKTKEETWADWVKKINDEYVSTKEAHSKLELK
ncbi:Hypothetical protein, predicted membrane protein [Metamycoplasma auris 15026]|uniref:Uncharacterized protein n=1 Tax=Metamycoplasma auris 15026 TaxID=1188233 RepID=N9VCN0_9BACT|nr:hypothetical protein [Metamycoplasma auris]ENY69151.1 Hypothetical protein, predicted membrane protein [Metamycoplasma auris 15026]